MDLRRSVFIVNRIQTKEMKKEFIIILIVAIALYAGNSFSTSLDDSAYAHLRQVDEIQQTGKPATIETKTVHDQPRVGVFLYDYLLALFETVQGGGKLLNALLFAALVASIYSAAFAYTQDQAVSLVSALAGSVVPAITQYYLGTFSTLSLALPLMIYALSLYTQISKKNAAKFVMVFSLVCFTHPVAILLAIGLLLYVIISKMMKLRLEKQEIDALLFTCALALWSQFILYKKAIVLHGAQVLKQNIPALLRADIFFAFSPTALLLTLGPVVVLGGLIAIATANWKHDDRFVRVFGSIMATVVVATMFRLVAWNEAMAILAGALAILLAKPVKELLVYWKKTKVSKLTPFIPYAIMLLIVLTSVPSILKAQESPHFDIEAISHLQELKNTK